MRYLADLLTLLRLILALVLFYGCVVHSGSTEAAFIIFLVAELTDVFDGTCARKWPFPKNKTPKYRKYAATYDMVSDVILAATQVLFLTIRVNMVAGLTIIGFYVFVCGAIELIVYGKLFGHPDNCTKNSLIRRNFSLAKKLVMTRRYLYTICLGIASALILFATQWPVFIKIGLFGLGCAIFVFAWFFLQQRCKNISRDAVDIEQKLSRETRVKPKTPN